jgi:hypothetical protein
MPAESASALSHHSWRELLAQLALDWPEAVASKADTKVVGDAGEAAPPSLPLPLPAADCGAELPRIEAVGSVDDAGAGVLAANGVR